MSLRFEAPLMARTFRDKSTNEDILATLEEIAATLEEDMLSLQYTGRCITVKYKVRSSEAITSSRGSRTIINVGLTLLSWDMADGL